MNKYMYHMRQLTEYMNVYTYIWRKMLHFGLTDGIQRMSRRLSMANWQSGKDSYLPDLMENAMGLLKIPLGLFASLVWQVLLENVEQINTAFCYSSGSSDNRILDWQVDMFQSMH